MKTAASPAPNLLCYSIRGSQPQFLTHDVPNPDHFCTVYVCAPTIREMAGLIAVHMPSESLPVCEIVATAQRSWQRNMQFIKPEPGVWAVKHPSGPRILRMVKGVAEEVDD